MDTGYGNEVSRALLEIGFEPRTIENVFISHSDSDHILGIVPLMRFIRKADHKIRLIADVYTHKAIESLFAYVSKKHWRDAQKNLELITIADGDKLEFSDLKLEFVETGTKVPMFGVICELPTGKKLFYPGDEPIRPEHYDRIENIDYLIHEAFCLHNQLEAYDPHKKAHGTALEAAQKAQEVEAKNLLLVHMEDETLETRKEAYAAEVKSAFSGEVFVPVDLDSINLS